MATKYFSLSNLSNGMKEQEKTIAQALSQLGLYKLYSAIGKTNTVENFSNFDYEQKNELALGQLMKYCAEYAGINADVESLKSPSTRRDKDFSKKFFGILQVATAPVIAEVVNQAFDHVAEIRNAGWGDSFLFRVGSPALFQVNMLARGINRGAAQRIYDENLTLVPANREVTVSMDWYQIAAGRYDMGDYLYRVGRSFAADMSQMAYNTLDATFASLPTPLKYSGAFSTETLDAMVQRLQAMNGQAIYGFGSLAALAKFPGPSAFIFSTISPAVSALSTAVKAAQFIIHSGFSFFTKFITISSFVISNSATSVKINSFPSWNLSLISLASIPFAPVINIFITISPFYYLLIR